MYDAAETCNLSINKFSHCNIPYEYTTKNALSPRHLINTTVKIERLSVKLETASQNSPAVEVSIQNRTSGLFLAFIQVMSTFKDCICLFLHKYQSFEDKSENLYPLPLIPVLQMSALLNSGHTFDSGFNQGRAIYNCNTYLVLAFAQVLNIFFL